MSRILVLDASGIGALAALVRDGTVLAARRTDAARGVAAILPAMAAELLREAGPSMGTLAMGTLGLVACVVGPGSFTGIRAALALAHGLGLALPAPVVGVTVGEALRAAADEGPAGHGKGHAQGHAKWVVVAARRGMVFLDRGGADRDPMLLDLSALPVPDGPVAVAGDAAEEASAALAARGHDVLLLDQRRPEPLGIAAAALLRRDGRLPPRPAQPLYAEPPMARTAPTRPPPAVQGA